MTTLSIFTRGLSAGALTLVLIACTDTPPPPSAIEQLADEYLAELMESDACIDPAGTTLQPDS